MSHLSSLSSRDGEEMYLLLKALVPPVDERWGTMRLWQEAIEMAKVLAGNVQRANQHSARFFGLRGALYIGMQSAELAELYVKAVETGLGFNGDCVPWSKLIPEDQDKLACWLTKSVSYRTIALASGTESLETFQDVFDWPTEGARFAQTTRALLAVRGWSQWISSGCHDNPLPEVIYKTLVSGMAEDNGPLPSDKPVSLAP